MVTEIVPQILSTRQRAELILGLRARVRNTQSNRPTPHFPPLLACKCLLCLFCRMSLIVVDPGVVSFWRECSDRHHPATSWPDAEPPNSVEHRGKIRERCMWTKFKCVSILVDDSGPPLYFKIIIFVQWCINLNFFLPFQTENAEQGVTHSQFSSLVQNLLRDPAERISFFQVCLVVLFCEHKVLELFTGNVDFTVWGTLVYDVSITVRDVRVAKFFFKKLVDQMKHVYWPKRLSAICF